MLSLPCEVTAPNGTDLSHVHITLSRPGFRDQHKTGSSVTFEPLRPGTYTVLAEHPDLLGNEKQVQAGEAVTLPLASSATVIVSVSNEEGMAVSKAELLMTDESGESLVFATPKETGLNGEVRVLNVRKGIYYLAAKHPWYAEMVPQSLVVDRVEERMQW